MPKIKSEKKIADKKEIVAKPLEFTEIIIESILKKNGEDVVIIDLGNIHNTLFDKFIICTANSGIQAETICDEIIFSIKRDTKTLPVAVEGKMNKEWILIDYFDTLVHVFTPETRSFFKLEQLWADAEIKHINN